MRNKEEPLDLSIGFLLDGSSVLAEMLMMVFKELGGMGFLEPWNGFRDRVVKSIYNLTERSGGSVRTGDELAEFLANTYALAGARNRSAILAFDANEFALQIVADFYQDLRFGQPGS